MASWLELTVLAEDDAVARRGLVLEAMRDSNLFADVFATRGDDRDSVAAESAASVLNETWERLGRRQRLLGDASPLLVVGDTVSRKSGKQTLDRVSSYTAMLLMEAAAYKWYTALEIKHGDPVRTWFEHIAAVSVGSLIGGRACRFGAPFPEEWPRPFRDRIRHLAGIFGIEARDSDVRQFARSQQKDDSLDIVARWKLADEEAGSPYLLIQCATGKNWETDKPGQPTMDLWDRYVDWDGPTYKALAVPFTLREKGKLKNASVRHGNAIVLDRLRIAAGCPDDHIDAAIRSKLCEWCAKKIAAIGDHKDR